MMSTTDYEQHLASQFPRSTTRIAIFCCFLNAGITTRGVEIAKALRELSGGDDGGEVLILRFFSWKGPESITYDYLASNAGFEITHYGPVIDKKTWNELLEAEHHGRGMQDKDRIVANIQGAVDAMKEFSADIIVHGVVPEAPIAAQILGIPNILYAPLPSWDFEWIRRNVLNDIPDAQSTWWTRLLPRCARRQIMDCMFERVKTKAYASTQKAAIECGWKPTDGDGGASTNPVYHATCYLLADLPSNYELSELGSKVEIIGPLFAGSLLKENEEVKVPPQVAEHLGPNKKNKVFVTLGSTGQREHVMEAIQALCMGNYNAVVALAPSRCGLNDVEHLLHGATIPDSVLVTEDFLPAKSIASMVDVVVGHGGQGTVQNALSSGTPIVGVAMQWEQQFNLDKNAVERGAGIRIPKRNWKARRIHASVQKVLSTKSYRDAAHLVRDEMATTDSARTAANIILRTARLAGKNSSQEVAC